MPATIVGTLPLERPMPAFWKRMTDRPNARGSVTAGAPLSSEYPPRGRKDDAGELLEIGDIVCGRCAAADLDVVVVPLQQSLPIEVQCLLCAVGRDFRGKADLQATPRFTRVSPRLEFFGFNAGSDQEKRSIQIRPHGAPVALCELPVTPGSFESVSLER